MLIFAVSVLLLFLAAGMFSSCALIFTFIFQELLISSGLNSLEFACLSCLESLPVTLSCVS